MRGFRTTIPLGETLLLRGTVSGHAVAIETDAHATVAPGDRVALSTRDARVHVSDPETGDAVHHGPQTALDRVHAPTND